MIEFFLKDNYFPLYSLTSLFEDENLYKLLIDSKL